MQPGDHYRLSNRISKVARDVSTFVVLAVLLVVFATTTPSFAQDSRNASDASTSGVKVRPGQTVVLLAGDYDAHSFVATRPITSTPQKSTTAIFEVEYVDFTPEAQAAFQAAVDVWSTRIASSVVIKIKASWTPLGLNELGSAIAPWLYSGFGGAPEPDVWYPGPLADALHGSDIGLGLGPDIIAYINSRSDDWYFGTDGETPNAKYDLMTVALKQIGHALGFYGSATVQGSQGAWGFEGDMVAYDQFTEDGDGNLITDRRTYPNPSVALGDALQGLFVFWGGPRTVSVNEGEPVHLFAPLQWRANSSYHNLSEEDYPAGDPDSLMTPYLSPAEAIHDPGPIALCMLQDIGWTTAQDCGDLPEATISYWVAAAARKAGAEGTKWRTRLALFNRDLTEATVEVFFHGAESSLSTTISIPPGEQVVIDDIVGTIGAQGTGSLEIVSNVKLVVGSRTYNDQGGSGTVGQFAEGLLSVGGVNEGARGWLTMLEETTAFRTNIGYTNTGSEPATVIVTLFDGTGAEVASFEVTIEAGMNVQENQPYSNLGGRDDITAGYASVKVVSGTGVLVYATVIDNLTGDPMAIPMHR